MSNGFFERFNCYSKEEIKESLESFSNIWKGKNGNSDFYIFDSVRRTEDIEDKISEEIGKKVIMEDIIEYITGDFDNFGYADEFVFCDKCNEVISSIEDHHFYNENHGDVYCVSCVKEDTDLQKEYIDYIKNDSERLNTILSQEEMINLGYNKNEEKFKISQHEDVKSIDPSKILNEIDNNSIDIVFNLQSADMFNIEYNYYYKKEVC